MSLLGRLVLALITSAVFLTAAESQQRFSPGERQRLEAEIRSLVSACRDQLNMRACDRVLEYPTSAEFRREFWKIRQQAIKRKADLEYAARIAPRSQGRVESAQAQVPAQRSGQSGDWVSSLLGFGVLAAIVGAIAKFFGVFGSGSAARFPGQGSSSGYRSSENYGATSSYDSASASRQTWFSDTFDGRTKSVPSQGFFESNSDYRNRVYLEGKERLIEDATGRAPSRGFFEGEDAYRSRIAHEANEHIVGRGSGAEPSQGFFESEAAYRERMHHEANERIVEGSTGAAPSQGFFESEGSYQSRMAHEANEQIVEAAMGSRPSQGFFESEESYKERINQEAKDIKASSRS
jgi:hypothetical protein